MKKPLYYMWQKNGQCLGVNSDFLKIYFYEAFCYPITRCIISGDAPEKSCSFSPKTGLLNHTVVMKMCENV